MIPYASQRGNGQDLATHLLNEYDNDLVELVSVRGAVARDLHGALKEWQVQAETLTKCKNYVYSLSINPDAEQGPLSRAQYMDYIRRTEEALNLSAQPRAIVFHTKYGREHCHVVWSRVDAEHGRAVHLAFDHDKLMRVTRAFARDHNLALPDGYTKSRETGQRSLHQYHQEQKTGLSEDDHKLLVTEAWRLSDSPRSFVGALAERGYLLARGDRDYVLVDLYGGTSSLPRMIDDKTVRMKQIREFLGKEFPKEDLPTVADAQRVAGKHRAFIERDSRDGHLAEKLSQLEEIQRLRRREIEEQRKLLPAKNERLRGEQRDAHALARANLRSKQMTTQKAVRLEREQNRPTGLAAFLGRVTGITFVREALQRRQDMQRLTAYREQRLELLASQEQQRRILETRLTLQAAELDRRLESLEKVDKRERAALGREVVREERVRSRDGDISMPSVAALEGAHQHDGPDVLTAFARSAGTARLESVDLLDAFQRASEPSAGESGAGGSPDQHVPTKAPEDASTASASVAARHASQCASALLLFVSPARNVENCSIS